MSTASFKRRLAAIERKLAKPAEYVAVESPRVAFLIHTLARHFGRLRKGEPVTVGYARACGFRGLKALRAAVEHRKPHRFSDRHRTVDPGATDAEIEAVRIEIGKMLAEPPAGDARPRAPPEPGSACAIFLERLAAMKRNSGDGAAGETSV